MVGSIAIARGAIAIPVPEHQLQAPTQKKPVNTNSHPSAATSSPVKSLPLPVRVGLVGTGFAAKLRAETLQGDDRATLVAVAGHTAMKTERFAQTYQAEAIGSWQQLVERNDIDLVMISLVNSAHGDIVARSLQAGKHVVVEYPLCLDAIAAKELISLASQRQLLLHVEHIELLGGLHNALKASLPEAGEVTYARYATITPQRPVPLKWTYNLNLFGFPFVGALSRLHRFTDLFGSVATVSAQARFWEASEPDYYTACLCTAQLRFTSGAIADLIYGKGDQFSKGERKFEVHGEKGTLIFDGDRGELVRLDEVTPLSVGTRRGLFARDTTMVLDYLTAGKPLYVEPTASAYTLKVADAVRRAAQTQETISLEN